MATATAICKCKHCGNEFKVYRRNFFNRRQADEWLEWAENSGNYDTCDKCYANQRAEERKKEKKLHDDKIKQIVNQSNENGNDIKEIHYSEYKNNYYEFDAVPDSYNAETKTIKVIIPNYDKKIEILDEITANSKPDDNDTEKIKIFNKLFGAWIACDIMEKINAIKDIERVNELKGRYKYDLNYLKSKIIQSSKENGLI